MARPLTRKQALENATFLDALRRTGNVREAARELGVHRSTFTKRRAKYPAFATEWDAALVVASAMLKRSARNNGRAGGEADTGRPRVTRLKSGRVQLRHAQPRRLTREAEQAFFAALGATANVRLSAAAAGFSHSAFYARRRQSPAFAREMRMALEEGYRRIELALLESWMPGSHADDAWRHNEPPPIPPMSANQALQLLHLHQKAVLSQDEPPHIKRRRGESRDAHSYRLGAMYEARQERAREAFEVAEAARRARGEPCLSDTLSTRLPDLGQVTGWSKADPAKAPHHPGRALFGGWRIEDLEKKRES